MEAGSSGGSLSGVTVASLGVNGDGRAGYFRGNDVVAVLLEVC